MKTRLPLVAALLIASWSTTAAAVPKPCSEADMIKAADLVVDAEGKTIVCDGKPVVTTSQTTTTYLSTLWPIKTYKGANPKSIQIRGKTVDWTPGPGPIGGWFQEPVPVGWVGKLYLQKESDGTYTKVCWNAAIEDKTKSKPQPLPTCGASSDAGVTPQNDALPTPQDGSAQDGSGPVPDASVTPPADGSATTDALPSPADGSATTDALPSPADGSATTDATGVIPSSSDGGCTIGAPTESDASSYGLLLLLGLAALLRRRRA